MKKPPLNPKDPYGDPEGLVTSPEQLKCSAATLSLVKGIADTLERHYPGWGWMVSPDERGGVVNLQVMRFLNNGRNWGFTFKTSQVQEDVRLRSVVKAGGELLERYGAVVGPYSKDAMRGVKWYLGQALADVSDLSRVNQRNYRTSVIQNGIASGAARVVMDADIARARAMRAPS